jgi:hypothetical protein
MLPQLLVNPRQAPREDGGGAEKNPTDSDDNGGNQYIAPKCPEVNLSQEHHLGVIRPRVRDDLEQLTAERFAFVRVDFVSHASLDRTSLNTCRAVLPLLSSIPVLGPLSTE